MSGDKKCSFITLDIMKSFNKFPNVYKNILILITGNLFAQFIPVILQPLLRRLFEPETFGSFAVYRSILNILVILYSMRYEQAIILPKKDKVAANLLYLVLIINLSFTVLSVIIVLFFKDYFVDVIRIPVNYSNILYILPISAFLFVNYKTINFWLIRNNLFRESAKNKVYRRISEGTINILLGLTKFRYGLFFGDILGNLTYNVTGYFHSRKSLLENRFSYSKIKYVIKRYKEFPLYNQIPYLFNIISLSLPALIVNRHFSAIYTGYFDLTLQILAVPSALISTAIANALLKELVDRKKKSRSVLKLVTSILVLLFGVAVAVCIVIYLGAEDLFTFLFGKEWIISGQIAKVLVFSYSIKFIVSTLSITFTVFERIKLMSVWQLLYFLVMVGLMFIKYIDFFDFIYLFFKVEVGMYILYLFFIIFIIYRYEKKMIYAAGN